MSNVLPFRPPVPGTVSHLAGAQLEFRNLVRQRCQWCSVVLVDEDLSLMAWPEGQGPPRFFWTVGAWIRIVPGSPIHYSRIESEEGLAPEDSCMFLGLEDPA